MRSGVSTIMVLEPDVIVRSEISEFLRQCGYQVIEGVCAEDLQEMFRAGKQIDVVLTEVRLKGATTGFQLAQELRQTRPQTAVILVSGIENVVDKATDLCGRGPVKKPYHPDDILRRIRMLTGRSRMSKTGSQD